MRVIALLAAHNEQRFIVPCIEHLVRQGVDVYLIDNESDDDTVPLAKPYLGRGLVGIEIFPRGGVFQWRKILERKEALARELDAEWFIHADPDEVRLPPKSGQTLVEALAEVDREGFNAVNFMEFTFVPTKQSPDHDHPFFMQTMRYYYAFGPAFPHRLNAWKKRSEPVGLAASGGHRVAFSGLKMFPTSFPMKHYLFLSVAHAARKYVNRPYDAQEMSFGWHGDRVRLRDTDILLQDEGTLRRYEGDDRFDASCPMQSHPIFSSPSSSL